MNRNIFTTSRPTMRERLADILAALALAAGLTIGLLAYFDILTY